MESVFGCQTRAAATQIGNRVLSQRQDVQPTSDLDTLCEALTQGSLTLSAWLLRIRTWITPTAKNSVNRRLVPATAKWAKVRSWKVTRSDEFRSAEFGQVSPRPAARLRRLDGILRGGGLCFAYIVDNVCPDGQPPWG